MYFTPKLTNLYEERFHSKHKIEITFNVLAVIGSLHQEFWLFFCSPVGLASRLSQYMAKSVSPLISIHDWICLSDPYGLFNPSCVYVALSLTLFCSRVNHLVVMVSTSFLCSSSLVPNVLCFCQCSCCYSFYKGSGIHSLSFCCLPLCLLDALVLFCCFDEVSQL